jgi:RNA polymerase sigma-70 factor (sigma-E family)
VADREAFDSYVRDRWEPLLRTAALLTGDAAAAEDLVQESLVRAARHWHRVDPGAIDSYVRRVMYTRSIDSWRWRRHQPDPVDTSRHDQVRADGTDELVSRLTLVDALSRLTPRQRAVLVARFYEDRTEVDTARVLGCSVSTVKSQTRHALERLRILAPELTSTFGREEAPR